MALTKESTGFILWMFASLLVDTAGTLQSDRCGHEDDPVSSGTKEWRMAFTKTTRTLTLYPDAAFARQCKEPHRLGHYVGRQSYRMEVITTRYSGAVDSGSRINCYPGRSDSSFGNRVPPGGPQRGDRGQESRVGQHVSAHNQRWKRILEDPPSSSKGSVVTRKARKRRS